MSAPSILSEETRKSIASSKVLVVGAGGIGCEVLKNLALSGFSDIEIIDLDTIDVSNLNRQFLFRKHHVGKSKAMVAKESILKFNPHINVKAYHDSITTQEYGLNFFKRFKVVLNALDNRAARNHVNRMCLAADVPLVESGTSGYTGQVEFIKKGLTQCYECQPKPPQKTFPGCTIRNTPSEPVHCIVWAKHLFNQLFGEEDSDKDVSPDTADPEAAGSAGLEALKEAHAKDDGNVARISTRKWAKDIDYDPSKLFSKFFVQDIKYLISMADLWKTRKQPVPLDWDVIATENDSVVQQDDHQSSVDMLVWSLKKCQDVFTSAISILKERLVDTPLLVWDKDDKPAMDFVTACTNFRAHIFSIPLQSRFSIKSIAGNIIPAIATANAVIAGLVVLIAFRVLAEEYGKCQYIYLRRKAAEFNKIVMADNFLMKPNEKCYVCSSQPFVNVFINTETMTVKEFETQILKNSLNMIAPDVMLDPKGICVISSEEGETEINNDKVLNQLGITDGSVLKVDDFLQNYGLTVVINHYEAKEKEDAPFKIVANPDDLKTGETNGMETESLPHDRSAHEDKDDDDDDAVEMLEPTDDPEEGTCSKRRKLNPEEEEDLIMLD